MPVERDYVFPELHSGMDHDHYDWSPLNATPRGAQMAGECQSGPVRHRYPRAHGMEPSPR